MKRRRSLGDARSTSSWHTATLKSHLRAPLFWAQPLTPLESYLSKDFQEHSSITERSTHSTTRFFGCGMRWLRIWGKVQVFTTKLLESRTTTCSSIGATQIGRRRRRKF